MRIAYRGEKRARATAPSIMAGGSESGMGTLSPNLCAQLRPIIEGPALCRAHVGPGWAGHFVKTVHNHRIPLIWQMIAEFTAFYSILNGMTPAALARQFEAWNEGPLASYLSRLRARFCKPPTRKQARRWSM